MNVFLWVLQILPAAVFAMAGSTKLLQRYDRLGVNPADGLGRWRLARDGEGDREPGAVGGPGADPPRGDRRGGTADPTAGTGLAVLMTLWPPPPTCAVMSARCCRSTRCCSCRAGRSSAR